MMKLDKEADVVVTIVGGKKRSFPTLRDGLLYCWRHLEDVATLRCDGTKIDLSKGILWKKE